jgi:uncharacterized OB-fold protein
MNTTANTTAPLPSKLVAEGLFRVDGECVHLLAGRRRADRKLVFPMPAGYLGAEYESCELPERGTLWSYTCQRFQPKPPFDGATQGLEFQPYWVGYVQFEGQLIVEGRLLVAEPTILRIGMAMTTSIEAYRRDENGVAVLTFAFTPTP